MSDEKPAKKKWAPRPKYCAVPNCGRRPDRDGKCARHGGTRHRTVERNTDVMREL